jgi:hypothetical protein
VLFGTKKTAVTEYPCQQDVLAGHLRKARFRRFEPSPFFPYRELPNSTATTPSNVKHGSIGLPSQREPELGLVSKSSHESRTSMIPLHWRTAPSCWVIKIAFGSKPISFDSTILIWGLLLTPSDFFFGTMILKCTVSLEAYRTRWILS